MAGGNAEAEVPSELEGSEFSDHKITPSPACLCVAPTGEVYVGVDLNGSLGKGPGKGRIVRLIDENQDGKADKHTVFAEIDNPRGLISVGTKIYVLHTVIPKSSGVLEAMHLSVLEDADRDGVADGPPKILVSNVSPPKHNQDRGADHTTNGIRMGIDGWIYIAVGDFGIVGAKGTDGTELTMLGGGIVRVRPDGTEMEIYTHGLRNIYDMAIDPLMNIFTRGNTNDGGGWNIRFIHQIQSGEYGYPILFKHFTDEIIPALADLGGGSGTGAIFFQEPGWPEKYNNVPMMCDWGRSQMYIHRLEPDAASFTQTPENFITLSQVSDVDVDGSGRMYLSAWNGAGYKGNPDKGWVQRVVPKGWTYKPFPDLGKADTDQLVSLVRSGSATARLHAQQELITRPPDQVANAVASVAMDAKASLESRVAAIFTYKQLMGEAANKGLLIVAKDPAVQEWALRAMADRLPQNSNVSPELFLAGLQSKNPRIQVAAAVGLGRLGKPESAEALLAVSNPPVSAPSAPAAPPTGKGGDEGPHATPNSAILVPHVAVRALVALQAKDAALGAVGGPNHKGAIWTLRHLHDATVVDGLIDTYGKTSSIEVKVDILNTLIRLYQKEAPYDGSWWWGTRPDTRGPYYKPEKWEASPKIESFVRTQYEKATPAERETITASLDKHRAGIAGIEGAGAGKKPVKNEPKVDLAKIANKKGEVGRMSIEDVILGVGEIKGNAKLGQKLFVSQGCIACHTTTTEQELKGPFMGHIGSIMKRDQIAESILKPNASISQGFATVMLTTKSGGAHVGFVSSETADEVEIRDITGKVTVLKAGDVQTRKELETSIMPPGLANSLSLQEFASLLAYLESMKK